MNLCKILIADDEKLSREAIKLHLSHRQDVTIVAECGDGKEALEKIIETMPDIIFLDIQMPYYSGIELLEKLPPSYNPFIIIITAYDNYALQAFNNDAIDYLLKPFTKERFTKALNKALKIFELYQLGELKPTIDTLEKFKSLLKSLDKVEEKKSTLSIKDGSKFFILNISDIHYIEAAGDYVFVHTLLTKFIHKDTLASLENTLPSKQFIRIHKSFIVNTNYIKELHSQYNGDYIVLLTNNSKLKLSRNYRERLSHLLS
jgi:two-component system LytT family response regulator